MHKISDIHRLAKLLPRIKLFWPNTGKHFIEFKDNLKDKILMMLAKVGDKMGDMIKEKMVMRLEYFWPKSLESLKNLF